MKTSFSLMFATLVTLVSSDGGLAAPVIHVVAHSHCDTGYRESFQEYWTTSVHSIIDSVLETLSQDQSKRFVWEEVSFLSTWWNQASNESRDIMKKLHSTGQLEFIGGGWVMHDEADPNLFGILNQMYQGLSFLRDTLETRPSVEWHIDPFGHSLFMPELYSQLGYKAVVINRIPDAAKQSMRAEKRLEFYWKYPNSKLSIFTHVLDTHYGTPLVLGFNTQSIVDELVPILKKRLQWFKTDQLLLPFGGDFNFKAAGVNFAVMDAIMKYINTNSSTYNMTMRYSTLSEYFNAVMNDGVSYEMRSNDFFPYIPCYPCGASECEDLPCQVKDEHSAYWSGFYSSKPAQKLLVREHEALLKSLEVLNALHPSESEEMAESLELGRNTSALLQHHDAITGTSFPPAFDDYNIRLNNAMKTNDRSIANLKASILCKESSGLSFSSDSASLLQGLGEQNMAAAVIHNPLPVQRSTYISVQLPNGICAQVFSSGQTSMPSQQVSSTLYFPVILPPWTMETVFLAKKDCGKMNDETYIASVVDGFSLSNGVLSLNFDSNNHLANWSTLSGTRASQNQYAAVNVPQQTHPLSQTYLQYSELMEQTSSATDGSNVYTFDPITTSPQPNTLTPKFIPSSVTARGPLVWEARQQINDFINATIRLYSPIKASNRTSVRDDVQHSSFAQWQTIIGQLPESPAMSVVSQFSSCDLNTEDYEFITYTNGFYPVTRQYNRSIVVQGNTYPLVGRVLASSAHAGHTPKEGSGVLSVVVERPMAVTGYNGSLEMMLHRRLTKKQDPRGDDSTVMNDSILIGFLQEAEASAISSRMMSLFQTPPTVHFALIDGTPDSIKGAWSKVCGDVFQWTPSKNVIPQGVEVIDLKLLPPASNGGHRVGLHIIYTDEHAPEPCSVNITGLFGEYTAVSVVEATPDFLEVPREHEEDALKVRERGKVLEETKARQFLIELHPLQLKSLIITLQ